MKLPRLVLCLTLLTPALGFAGDLRQEPDPSAQPAPQGAVFPRERTPQDGDDSSGSGRVFFSPIVGTATAAIAGVMGFIPTLIVLKPICPRYDPLGELDEQEWCEGPFYTGIALSAALGVAVGVMALGKLTGGKGRLLPSFIGAVAGSAVGVLVAVAARSPGAFFIGITAGPALGATVGYEISHANAVESASSEYAGSMNLQVAPVVSITPGGGIFGGLAGRF